MSGLAYRQGSRYQGAHPQAVFKIVRELLGLLILGSHLLSSANGVCQERQAWAIRSVSDAAQR
jgi:hypothetical protein